MKRLWNSESAVMVSEGFCPSGHGKLTVRELSDFGAEPTSQGGKQAGCLRGMRSSVRRSRRASCGRYAVIWRFSLWVGRKWWGVPLGLLIGVMIPERWRT